MGTINDLATLVRYAANGARGDSAIDDTEEGALLELARILEKTNCDSLDNLRERLSHHCA